MSRDGRYLPEKKTNDCPVKTGLTGPMRRWKGEGEGAERRGGDVGRKSRQADRMMQAGTTQMQGLNRVRKHKL
jgi:hypothetical protein